MRNLTASSIKVAKPYQLVLQAKELGSPTRAQCPYRIKDSYTIPKQLGALLLGTLLGVAILTAHVSPALAASAFKTDAALYPSVLNPNWLPNGTLVKTAADPAVFYLRDGKRSWVLPKIIDQWFGEAYYLAKDVVTVISTEDMRRYPQVTSVNPLYIGKILQHPDGGQFFIDDKLRKRKLSAKVRAALKYPSRNLYLTSAAHLNEFSTGEAIVKTDLHPGGTVMYNGPYHGGTVWRIEQAADGSLKKRFYLHDYLYETEGYPWSSQILPVSTDELGRYARGANIERYSDGWVVGFDSKRFVVQKGALRHIAATSLFDAMGYKSKYVLSVYPEFLRRYPLGKPIAAFKNIVVAAPAPTAPSNTLANVYPQLRPAARAAIAEINTLFLITYDRPITATENSFWLDFIYRGELHTKEELLQALQRAKATGKRPAPTSRTAAIDSGLLRSRWFPYLFYFVWHQEPSVAAREYWHARIVAGDRDTIDRLQGGIEWLKASKNVTHQ